jgi:hypothetical protein
LSLGFSRVLSGLILLLSLAVPDSVRISSGAEQRFFVGEQAKNCATVAAWSYSDLEMKIRMKVSSRPLDYAIALTSAISLENGLALTVDKFGNVFFQVRSRDWEIKNPVVFLLSSPFIPGTEHLITVNLRAGTLSSASVDGVEVALKSLDGVAGNQHHSLETEINRLCVGDTTPRPLDGSTSVTLLVSGEQRTIQLALVRVFLLAISLMILLKVRETAHNP